MLLHTAYALYLEIGFNSIILDEKADGECRLQRELGTLMTANFGTSSERPVFLKSLMLPNSSAGNDGRRRWPSWLQLLFSKESGISYYAEKGIESSAFLRTVFLAEPCVQRAVARAALGTTTLLLHLPLSHDGKVKIVRKPDAISPKYAGVIVDDGMLMVGTNIIIDIMVQANICSREMAEEMLARGPAAKVCSPYSTT